MKRLIFLMLAFSVGIFAVNAQSNQELLEAYRNGTLSQSQIENLKKDNENKNKNVRRTRQVNETTTNKSEQTKVTEDTKVNTTLTNMPVDPRKGLLETRQTEIDTIANVTVAQRGTTESTRRI